MSGFGDYVVYADESGSPTLGNPDPEYPIFVLAFVVARKSVYCENLVPDLQKLKFRFFGHDQIVLHERDIRRQSGTFSTLRTNAKLRADFLQAISDFVTNADLRVMACVIRKDRLPSDFILPPTAYELAVMICMAQLRKFLAEKGQTDVETPVILEARGHTEDRALELEFRRLADNANYFDGMRSDTPRPLFIPIFADKKSNSSGLQIADLFARPIGRKALAPEQSNRAFDTISRVLHKGEFQCPF